MVHRIAISSILLDMDSSYYIAIRFTGCCISDTKRIWTDKSLIIEEKLHLKKRNKVLLTGATLLTVGGVTGYAATNIFANLDAIKENYDITFNFAKSQKQKADELQQQLDNESGNKEQLQNEINNLKSEIENIKTNHAQEITNKQADIDAKQAVIDEKQALINEKQQEITKREETITKLTNDLTQLTGELAQVEAKVNELLNYTNDRTNELVGGE